MCKYKCIKGFILDIYDGDGFTMEEGGFMVEEGSMWEVNEEAINVLGTDVHIENEKGWIEITNEMLENHFIKIK